MHAADTDNLNKTGKYNDSKAIVNKDTPNMTFLVKKTITRRNPKDMTIFNTTYFQFTVSYKMCKKTVVEKIGFSVLQKQRLIMEKGVSNAGAILTKIDSVVHYMYQF